MSGSAASTGHLQQSQMSLFDIIGPVMVGPSSSHTAGAVRLGQIGRALLGGTPRAALLELHGSFAHTGRGHGTDRALVAGLLGWSTADPRIRQSLDLATAEGLAVQFRAVDLGPDAHPNTVQMTLEGAVHTVSCAGASVGGGMVCITAVDGYEVSFSAEYDTLLIVSPDRPGTINAVTNWLAAHDINVAFLQVARRKRGGEAIMMVEMDEPATPSVVEGLASFPWVRRVSRIGKVNEA